MRFFGIVVCMIGFACLLAAGVNGDAVGGALAFGTMIVGSALAGTK